MLGDFNHDEKKKYRTDYSYKSYYELLDDSLLLFKLYNETRQTEDWMDLNWNQAFNNSYMNVRLFDVLKNKVGKNILTNRLATAFLKGSKNFPLSALHPPPSALQPGKNFPDFVRPPT